MGDVVVSGGPDGISAQVEELLAMAATIGTTGTALDDAAGELDSPAVGWPLLVTAAADRAGATAIGGALEALISAAHRLSGRLGGIRLVLVLAAVSYRETEHHVDTWFHRALTELSSLGAPIPPNLVASVTGVPEEDLTPLFALPRGLAWITPDGTPVLHDRGLDDTETVPPRTLGNLVLDLSARNQGSPGDISVSFVTGADGRRRAIVDIPGTKSWNPAPVADVTSVGTDIKAIAGHTTTYERGIFAALDDAGVGPDTEVMLVGHSEGGIVAADAAIHAAQSGRYRITHVVTAGAPVGQLAKQLPRTVAMLCLENTDDIVPELDAVENPDRPNVTTVKERMHHGSIHGNHDLDESYEPLAIDAQMSGNGSVEAFLHSARGYLSSPTMTTHVYQVVRAI